MIGRASYENPTFIAQLDKVFLRNKLKDPNIIKIMKEGIKSNGKELVGNANDIATTLKLVNELKRLRQPLTRLMLLNQYLDYLNEFWPEELEKQRLSRSTIHSTIKERKQSMKIRGKKAHKSAHFFTASYRII